MGRVLPFAFRRLVPLALLAGAAAIVIVAPVFALTMAPGFFLLLLLANGIRPCEQLIVRHRLRRARRRPEPAIRFAHPRVRVVRAAGHLLAFALAMRPPPAAPASVLA
jgi:hypothetical protein